MSSTLAGGGSGVEDLKRELEAVLQSPAFQKAPGLAKFLTYICDRHFAGQADRIKEYNIAVEALGRPADFDQKADSIVRVEANRLRKRLREYYETQGKDHAVQISIPSGQYAPVFVRRELPEPKEAPPAAAPEAPLRRRWTWTLGLVVLAAAVLVAVTWTRPSRPGGQPAFPEQISAPPGDEVRILAGSIASRYVDKRGHIWLPDRFSTGGEVLSSPASPILRTRDPAIFRQRREGEFQYDIPLKPGVYEMRLWFAETVFGPGNIAGGGETSRLFDIYMNGRRAVTQLDVVSNAGGSNTADAVVFKDVSPAPDGFLHLRFVQFKERAILSAIEILPGIPGRLRPILMVAGETGVEDSQGRRWEADCCVDGGQTVVRPTSVLGTADPALHRSERFGNFNYSIPVAPGRYAVTLKFSETWFGAGKPGGGGKGSRLFDVFANGVALLRNFDIFKEAGGPDRAVERTFHGITPNAQGKIVLSFVPVRNYACVNAIAIVDESD